MPNTLKMAWRFLRIDWRSGELQLLFLSLLLAVTIVAGLTGFVGRLELMLAGESSQFLAADRQLQSPRVVSDNWLQQADNLGLEQARLVNFQSMLYADDEPLLVSVKAASNGYPLIGKVNIRDQLYSQDYPVAGGPPPGEIWAERRLLQQLDISPGSEVYIGEAALTLTKVLVSEPDRGAGFISMGPRVLMHYKDVAATEVITEGSRITYAWLFAGEAGAIQQYEQWLEPQLADSDRWLNLEDNQPSVAIALERAKTFFLLASSIVIVLAVIAVAMTSQRYCQRHVKHIAVLKTLGATSGYIRNLYTGLLLLLFVAVSLLGCLLAYGLQQGLLTQVATELEVALPPTTTQPFILGMVTALISLLAFTLPALARLKAIPAVAIFRQSMRADLGFGRGSVIAGFVGLLLLLLLYTQQLLLSAVLMTALLLVLVIIALPARLMLKNLPSTGARANSWWAMALANLRRRLAANALQLGLFAISLMLLLVLLGVRDSLFNQWQSQLPADTPNFFLVNIQPHEVTTVARWLSDVGVKTEAIYPMIRGRLVEINNVPVRERVSKEGFKRSGADRELNLSWAEQLPPDNKILAGEWNAGDATSGQGADTVSVESELAEKLNIGLGDQLTFRIAAVEVEAVVGSIREVDWERMRPNFYMLLPKASLQNLPQTSMTSFYLPDELHPQIAELLKAIPTAIVIEVDTIIKQIRSIIHHVSLALQLVLVFVMLGSVLVMVATVQHSLDSRKKENTVIRALGGSKRLIVGSLIGEFVIIGFIAGVLATVGAELILLALQQWLMKLPLELHPELWYLAPLLGTAIVGFAGYIAARRVTRVAPMQLLREN
ncbi:ABC transporter permease [Sinobacterium norvegicum]|nr:FtsX-like permease family protein [Sinobacterium norvegicum]